jgi:hypothetical protein
MSEIRMLDDLGAQFARIAESPPRRRPWRVASGHAVAVAGALVVLLGAGVYAVPATRAAIDDITSSLGSWVAGDEEAAPGRALRPEDDAPDWLGTEDTRLIAKVRDLPLYVSRTDVRGEEGLGFSAGNAFGIWDSVEGWRSQFDNHAVMILGPSPVSRTSCDEFALFGVTAGSVAGMALTYASGEPTRAEDLDGGFAVIADAHRPLDEVIVYDEAGRELERADASYITGLGSKCIELNRRRAEGG